MKLTCALNDLNLTELDIKTEIIKAEEQSAALDDEIALQNKELQSLSIEVDRTRISNCTLPEEIIREQAKMETLILDHKAKQKALEPKLVKVELAEERLRKYEVLI